jgi:hypothetical protein
MMKAFYIDYPQEKVDEHKHVYRCAYCKIVTTTINGLLENHAKDCQYRLQQSLQDRIECDARSPIKHDEFHEADEVD